MSLVVLCVLCDPLCPQQKNGSQRTQRTTKDTTTDKRKKVVSIRRLQMDTTFFFYLLVFIYQKFSIAIKGKNIRNIIREAKINVFNKPKAINEAMVVS